MTKIGLVGNDQLQACVIIGVRLQTKVFMRIAIGLSLLRSGGGKRLLSPVLSKFLVSPEFRVNTFQRGVSATQGSFDTVLVGLLVLVVIGVVL